MNIKQKALEFATKAHEGQFRKVTQTPYIVHPIAVANTLESAGFDDEVVAAGYLHDTIEDTSVTFEMIADIFGLRVAKLVLFNTEDKTKDWEERKIHTIESLPGSLLEERALVVADKLDNLSRLNQDFLVLGDKVWASFKRGKEQQKWYFSNVSSNSFVNLSVPPPSFFSDYKLLVEGFFGS